MEETTSTGFEEFFGAFEDSDGGLAVAAEDAEVTQTTEDETAASGSEAADGAQSDDNSEGENTNESDETAADGEAEAEKQEEKRSFDNIKVNGEIRSVSYDDAPEWIQKGMDYDRVKGKLEEERQANAEMKQTLEKHQAVIDVLDMISQDTGVNVDELLHTIHKSYRMQSGESEKEAEANIRAAKAERQSNQYKEQRDKQQNQQKDQQERANREYAEFRAAHPDVKLDDALVEKLRPDVSTGLTLLGAYQKMLNQQQAEKIAALEKQLAAEKQNKKNAATSPGSQKDSGGQRKRDAFDDFFDAFDK
jgi:hypothetical protein